MDEFSDGRRIFAAPQKEIVWSRTDDPTKWGVPEQPIGWVTEDYETDKSATTYNAETARRWLEKGWPVTPLYTAPPKREWQGLTDEEIEEGYERCWVESKQAWESAVWWAEAKLKDKNT